MFIFANSLFIRLKYIYSATLLRIIASLIFKSNGRLRMTELVQQLASELAVRPAQIEAAIRLMDDGASVPFIARYRKEITEGLDDAQLRQLEARLAYLRELNERRQKVIDSIRSQEKLTTDLLARLNAADSKTALEDLYLPYRPKKNQQSQPCP
jgi:uncharacterized protein